GVGLEHAAGRLLPGMIGRAALRFPAARQGLLIPAAALVEEGAERYVLVEMAPGEYQRRNVVVEGRRGGLIQVRRDTGLFPADRVLTSGSHELAEVFRQGVLRLSPEAERGIGLEVMPVARRPVAETLTVPAEVDLPTTARAVVSSRLAGSLVRLLVDRDQEVRAGEPLAEVYSAELLALQLDL